MEVGRKLRELRQARHLSQGDIEKKVGLLRCYTSRIENGMTIPSVETLEKLLMPWRFLYTDSSLTVRWYFRRSCQRQTARLSGALTGKLPRASAIRQSVQTHGQSQTETARTPCGENGNGHAKD